MEKITTNSEDKVNETTKEILRGHTERSSEMFNCSLGEDNKQGRNYTIPRNNSWKSQNLRRESQYIPIHRPENRKNCRQCK